MEKMSLWQIDANIETILDRMVDEETGEINEDALASLEELEIAKADKVEAIACYIKNLKALAESIKSEKMKLAKRQQVAENKMERLKKHLLDSLNGEKMQSAKYSISFRTTNNWKVTDEEACMTWLYDRGYTEYIKVETSVVKDEVKKLCKSGAEVPGTELITETTITVK